MELFNIKSKSKLNLYLNVGHLRDDGYHEIRTIMTKIDLGDKIEIAIEPAEKLYLNIKCDDDSVPTDERNTIIKFIKKLNEIKPINYNIKLYLNKNVPSQAGLGGASGDAAAVVLWLNDYMGDYFSREELVGSAKFVGADVPFFLFEGILELGGIGDEIIQKYESFNMNFVVAKLKRIGINTKDAYKNLKINLTNREENIILMRKSIFNKDIKLMASALKNDFEEHVFEQYKDIYSLKNKIIEMGALGACLTGSGSAVYGIVKDEKQALSIKNRLSSPGVEVFACKSTA